jgi:hypothetical protein
MVIAFEFEFVFHAQLMLVILGYTNVLSQSLQTRDQDIVNAMTLIKVAKDKMQAMRSHGWEAFLAKVTLFCNKYGIQVPFPSDNYVPHGTSLRFYLHKQMMIILEDKSILVWLIKLSKRLTIGLMRLIWRCLFACHV